MPGAIVIGGGLAGLASAAALGASGFEVDLFEARGFLGGRATSYPLNTSDGAETIDNCQHILLRCCVNLLDFYARLGVADRIEFHDTFYFIEPGGRVSTMRAGVFPRPFHFAESFLRMRCFDRRDKIAIGRGLLALQRERASRTDLDRITMLDWLQEKRQTPRAIERFWRQVLVSAVNEDLDRMAARHGFQVFWLGFLASRKSYEMGVPAVPLGDLYSANVWDRIGNVRLNLRSTVDRVTIADGAVTDIVTRGIVRRADYYIVAVPFERLCPLVPELEVETNAFTHSPITGIHLWFDKKITDLPHATLLDRTMQWMFNKGDGRYLQLVVSASRSLLEMSRGEVIDLAVRELTEFFPNVRDAKIEKAHVVKEVRATFSAQPGVDAARPCAVTKFPNLFLAGDWTRSGWPATMEGAVRSGYIAAEAVAKSAGRAKRFLLPDIA
jgi:squalene-associated FAD-dependent desaturase